MKIKILLLLILAVPVNLSSQELEIFGYLENELDGLALDNKKYILNYNKLRVDISSRVSKNASFKANYNYITFHGKTDFNLLEFLPDEVIPDIVRDSLWNMYQFPYNNRNFLDNAFLKISFGKLDITAGKQQISTGTGYAWNPTDVFNIKNLLDPTYEQPGHNALRTDVALGPMTGLSAILAPGEDWAGTTKMIRLKSGAGHFDFSAVYAELQWTTTDYLTFYRKKERRRLAGMDFAGQLGIGLWGEGAWNRMESSEDYIEFVLGADYTFKFQTYLMTEYYHNGVGAAGKREYRFNDWLQFMSGERKGLARDYVFIFIQHPLTDLLGGGAFIIKNVNDGSYVISPRFFYTPFENVEIITMINLTGGDKLSEYGNFKSGGLLRFRVYF
ncbi:MAG: hypothetical protein ACE5QV_01955 [Fidelibacterota bacterium]